MIYIESACTYVCEEDLPECLDVIRRSFSTVAEDFGLTPENAPTNPAFMKAERLKYEFDTGKLMFKLMDESKIIGFVQLRNNENGTFEFERLAVLPEYRHHGYGKMLIEYTVKTAKELGAKELHAGIIDENTVLKNWYLKNGFEFIETAHFAHLPFTVGYIKYDLTKENV